MDNSDFQFNNFNIRKSLIELTGTPISGLSLDFEPSGLLDKNNSKFQLILKVVIGDESKDLKIEVEAIGNFGYNNLDEESLQNFLFLNAPAILFPYIRAYISTLTSLSGINPVVLPTLNLSSLRDKLSKNIKEINLVEQ